MKTGIGFFCFFFCLTRIFAEDVNLVINPSFSDGFKEWSGFWSRDSGTGSASLVQGPAASGPACLKITQTGKKDWSFGQNRKIPVTEGEIYRISGMVKAEAVEQDAMLCIITYDSSQKVLDWAYAEAKTAGTHDWTTVTKKFIIPAECCFIQFRLIGTGKGISYWDDLSLLKLAGADSSPKNAKSLVISNAGLVLEYSASGDTIKITDKKGGQEYLIKASGKNSAITQAKSVGSTLLTLKLFNAEGDDRDAFFRIVNEREIEIGVKGRGQTTSEFGFPGRITAEKGQSWVIPINEGLLVPADDPYFDSYPLVLFSGHGLCMPFIGLTNGKQGMIAIAETFEDAGVDFMKPGPESTSSWSFLFFPESNKTVYERKLRLMFLSEGGHTGIAKRYRKYVESKGLLITLKEKKKAVPQLEKLYGAVNLWFWADAKSWRSEPAKSRLYAEKIRKAGIERVLWSTEDSPENIAYFNFLGFLPGRYDCYQDVYSPDVPIQWVNRNGWPDDIILLPSGDWMKGWVTRENGKEYPGGVICAERSIFWMKKTIPVDLKSHAYGARFIDTTTASPLRECYHPKHPGTRSDDRKWKSAMLEYISRDLKLVTGSETGMDWAVPYLHYFEGMMSLGPYRLPDSGYDLSTYIKPDESFLRFQTGPYYRIPLFELVYHDCAISYWYWGDSSNRVPEAWTDRDLLNALYGNPPLWIVDCGRWDRDSERFLSSYRNGTQTAFNTAESEMVSHSFLHDDHTVQQTVFANGTKVWVNFGTKPYTLPGGKMLEAKSYRME